MLGPFGMGHPRPRFFTADVSMVGNPATDVRGQDLRLRVVHAGQVLPARAIRCSSRFEEVRGQRSAWSLVYTPRINPRGEDGPVYLEIHELHAGPVATNGIA
jgi:hypothetical protein